MIGIYLEEWKGNLSNLLLSSGLSVFFRRSGTEGLTF